MSLRSTVSLALCAVPLACTPRPTASLTPSERAEPEVQAPEQAAKETSKAKSRWVDLSIETEFGCAVENTGVVHCWGRGPAAQMDLRELPEGPPPTTPNYGNILKWGPASRLEVINDATAVSTANSRACAIVDQGHVRCWGSVRWGSQHVYDVAGISSAVEIEIGDGESCVILEDRELWCWGVEDYGIPRTRLVDVVAMAVSDNLACGLTSQGDVTCWGQAVKDWHRYNIQFQQRQQAPNLNPQPSPSPPEPDPDTLPDRLEIGRFRGAADLALSGWNNLCVLQRDGKVQCSVQDVFSLLNGQELVMREVAGTAGVTSLAATRSHTCATTQAGPALCWGRNVYGQLGDGGATTRDAAGPVADLEQVVAVAVAENSSCALTRDDRLACWGYDLGEGLGHDDLHVNTVEGLRASSIAAFGRTTCAVDDSQTLRCWGSDMLDQIGIAAAATPTTLAMAGGEILAFNSGWEACFLRAGAPLQCGNASAYSTGSIAFNASTTITDVRAFAAGSPPVCMIAGPGRKAELRCGQSFNSVEPERRIKSPTALSSSHMRACVVHGGGQVSCFGELYTWNDLPPPPRDLVEIAGVRDAIAVSSSTYHDCVLHKSGKVSCWVARTESEWSEDGRTPLANHYKPSTIQDMGLVGAKQIVAGVQQHCALLAKGAVRCWSDNPYGEGTQWLALPELGEAVELAAGSEHVCARDEHGAVTCWGDDVWGQLGRVPSRVYLKPTIMTID